MPELARYRPDAASVGVMPEWLRHTTALHVYKSTPILRYTEKIDSI